MEKVHDKNILKLHKKGLSNRQIAVSLKLSHHCLVGEALRRNGLESNTPKKQKLIVDGDRGKCTKCGEWKPIAQFKMPRNKNCAHPYRLTYCNPCCWQRRNIYLNTNKEAYARNRFNGLKQHAISKKKEFNLDLEYVEMLWQVQKGKCAYTGEKMTREIGKGLMDSTMSFDRFDNNKGYIKGNVLLCSKLANAVKSGLELEKLKKWIPGFYKKGCKTIEKINAAEKEIFNEMGKVG